MSIVIVKCPEGYTAHIRLSNPRLDREFSSETHWGIYEKVDKYLSQVGEYHASL